MSDLVSVLIPLHNAERWIAKTLSCLANQTHYPIEVIVVDDGSTDDSLRIASEFIGDGITLISQKNLGACAARNRAFRESRGEFVQFLDADDVIAPDKIERQLARLRGEPEGSVATCAWARFTDDNYEAAVFNSAHDWKDYENPIEWVIDCGLGQGTMPTVSWLIPRSVAQRVGPWDERLLINQDGEYFARVVLNAARICFCESARAFYRSGVSGSVSQQKNPAALQSQLESIRLIETVVLERENSSRTRMSLAGWYQALAFRAYNVAPLIAQEAERRATSLGGSNRKPGVIRPLRPVRDYIGWKPALRAQHAYDQIQALCSSFRSDRNNQA